MRSYGVHNPRRTQQGIALHDLKVVHPLARLRKCVESGVRRAHPRVECQTVVLRHHPDEGEHRARPHLGGTLVVVGLVAADVEARLQVQGGIIAYLQLVGGVELQFIAHQVLPIFAVSHQISCLTLHVGFPYEQGEAALGVQLVAVGEPGFKIVEVFLGVVPDHIGHGRLAVAPMVIVVAVTVGHLPVYGVLAVEVVS